MTTHLNGFNSKFPKWGEKISKVVCRGGLSGSLSENENDPGQRYHLNNFCTPTYRKNKIFLNEKITEIPNGVPRNVPKELRAFHESDKIPQDDFQNSRAILVFDGHSWSS
jgi:hypothetical protein